MGFPPRPVEQIDLLQWLRDDMRGIMGRFSKQELTWSGGELTQIDFYDGPVLVLSLILTWTGGNLTAIERIGG